MQTSETADAELDQVRAAVQHYVAARTEHDVEDVVQESMARLLAARDRLARDGWPAYAVATARNLLVSRRREQELRRRHRHRLHAPDTGPTPLEHVLVAEEQASLQRALAGLSGADRELLLRHYSADPDRPARTVSGVLAARLSRARARLRVAYVVEYGRLRLPTPRCRPVLEALSAGDRRRQQRLGTGRHLMVCEVCSQQAETLLVRRRALAGLDLRVWAVVLAAAGWRALRRNPGPTTAVAATAVVAASVVVLVAGRTPAAPPPPAPAAAPAPVPAVRPAGPPALRPGADLAPGPVSATDLPVDSVPADEGFWVGAGPGRRTWVQLVGVGESAATVRAGDRVSFTGQVRSAGTAFPTRVGLTRSEGAAELVRQGDYVQVSRRDLRVRRR